MYYNYLFLFSYLHAMSLPQLASLPSAFQDHRLGQLILSDLWYSKSRPSGKIIARSSAFVSLYLGRSFLPDVLLLPCYYSCVCFFLLFHLCCSHALGILCRIHTSSMGALFPIVYAKWSLVFRYILSPILIIIASLVFISLSFLSDA